MTLELNVQNIKCGGCANTITTKLSQLEGISDVKVDVNSGVVIFESETVAATQVLVEKLKALGYPMVNDNNGLGDKARSFLSCATGRMMKE